MERNPLRIIWLKGFKGHFVFALLLCVMAPFIYLALDLPRQTAEALATVAHHSAHRVAFMNVVWSPPAWLVLEPLTIWGGVMLNAREIIAVTVLSFTTLLILAGLVAWIVSIWRNRAAEILQKNDILKMNSLLAQARFTPETDIIEALSPAVSRLYALTSYWPYGLILPMLGFYLLFIALTYTAWLNVGSAAVLMLTTTGLLSVWTWQDYFFRRRQHLNHLLEYDTRDNLHLTATRWPATHAHGAAWQEMERIQRLSAAQDARHRPLHWPLAILSTLNAGLWIILILLPLALIVQKPQSSAGICLSLMIAVATAALAVFILHQSHIKLQTAQAHLEAVHAFLARLKPLQGIFPASRPREAVSPPSNTVADQLVWTNLSAHDPQTGARTPPLNGDIAIPLHVAVTGARLPDVQAFLATCAGVIEPVTGDVRFKNVNIFVQSATERAKLIAYVSPRPVAAGETWFDNLTYGALSRTSPSNSDTRLRHIITGVGLSETLLTRALSASFDPETHADLADKIITVRQAAHHLLTTQERTGTVEMFARERYNRHASIGENILFGVPVGDTFSEAYLGRHPFMKAVLATEQLGDTLVDLGQAIVLATHDMFEGIADDHPLFARFSLMPASERAAYADILVRSQSEKRAHTSAEDRTLLTTLALRYVETRHRLGLLTPELESRLLKARQTFSQLLPGSLSRTLVFYDPDRALPAASFQDNILLGRVAYDVGGAQAIVRQIIDEALSANDMRHRLIDVGLQTAFRDWNGLPDADTLFRVDLTRCLLREPVALVLAQTGAVRSPDQLTSLFEFIRAECKDRLLLIACSPQQAGQEAFQRFDRIMNLDEFTVETGRSPLHSEHAL